MPPTTGMPGFSGHLCPRLRVRKFCLPPNTSLVNRKCHPVLCFVSSQQRKQADRSDLCKIVSLGTGAVLELDWDSRWPPGAHFQVPAYESCHPQFCTHRPLQIPFLCLQHRPEQERVRASLCPTQSGIACLFSQMASGRAHSPCQVNVGCLLDWLLLLGWCSESQV